MTTPSEIRRAPANQRYFNAYKVTMGEQRENRGITDIEGHFREGEFPFSFKEHLRTVSGTFPGSYPLHVFDSGCGDGVAMGEIRAFGQELGRPIRTTGITLIETSMHNTALEERSQTDVLIVGSLQDADEEGELDYNSVHFLLDFAGPLKFDDFDPDNMFMLGSTVIPIYSKLLVSGGTAVFGLRSFSGVETTTLPQIKKTYAKTLQLFEDNDLEILRKSDSGYILLQKK